MLTDDHPFLSAHNLHRDPQLEGKLRGLADDIARIREGSGPLAGELAAAPKIDRWRTVVTSQGVHLIGRMKGHPRIGDGPGMTTGLWVADPSGSWVRTLSRFYVLERPFDVFGDDGEGYEDV